MLAPISPYLQPYNIALPDPHIGPNLIPPDGNVSSSQQAKYFSNLITLHLQPSPTSEHESTGNSQKEDTNSTKTKIYHPLDYATNTRSHLPEIDPIPKYFQLPTLIDPSTDDRDELYTSAITHQAELLRWYYRLVHLSFKTLRLLVNFRVILYHLRGVHPPKCAPCMFRATTKKNWQTK